MGPILASIEQSLSPPRQRVPHPRPALARISDKADNKLKRVLSPQARAARREKQAADGRAAIARVELTLIRNRAFVARVEKPWDAYSHMRSEAGYQAALAALTR